MSSSYNPIRIKSLKPLFDGVIVADMAFTSRVTSGGIVLPSDDKQVQGVHPRWGRVYSVGPDQKDIKPGQWVCVAHGRWTRGVHIIDDTGEHTIRRIDNNDILLVSDEQIADDNLGRPL